MNTLFKCWNTALNKTRANTTIYCLIELFPSAIFIEQHRRQAEYFKTRLPSRGSLYSQLLGNPSLLSWLHGLGPLSGCSHQFFPRYLLGRKLLLLKLLPLPASMRGERHFKSFLPPAQLQVGGGGTSELGSHAGWRGGQSVFFTLVIVPPSTTYHLCHRNLPIARSLSSLRHLRKEWTRCWERGPWN